MEPLSPAFTRLAWSNLLAQSAEQLGLAAVPLVAVLALGAGAGETGLLAAAQTLPFLLLSLPLGVLADRMPRRFLMSAAEWLRAAALLALPMLAGAGLASVPALGVLGFLAATGTVAYGVAAPSLVPALVPRALLSAANGRLELVRSLAFFAGPALGGVLVAWSGPSPAFVLAGMLSAGAALLLRGLAEPPRPATPCRAVMHDLREGAAFTWTHPLLRPILLTAVAWNVSWFVLQGIYAVYAVDRLGLSAAGVGGTLAAYGAGMVGGAAAAPWAVRTLPFGRVILLGPAVSVVAALVMLASVWQPGIILPAASFFLFGAGPILWTIAQTTLRQAVTPVALLGRVSALVTMATFGARPLGAALGALVGGTWGPVPCIALAVAGFAMQAAVILLSPVPGLARLPETAG